MSGEKVSKEKNIPTKSEVETKDTAQQVDFEQDIPADRRYFDEIPIDVQPPTPCSGYNSSSDATTVPSDATSLLLQEEIIPALNTEIRQTLTDTIKSLLKDETVSLTKPHCPTCTCSRYGDKTEEAGYEPLNPDFLQRTLFNHGIHQNEDIQLNPHDHKSQNGAYLTKYPSDQQLKQCGEQQDQTNSLFRTRTIPLLKRHQTPMLGDADIKTTRKVSDYDRRECMAHALQWHVHALVDSVIVTDSELPDSLIRDGCLTEEECSSVRQRRDRRDQVRVLLRVIKGRDMRVLNKFLQHIRSHNEDVARTVQIKYEQNIRDGMRCSKCARCQLTTQVNLKYMADSLWRYSLIDEGIYNLITETSNPTGTQGELWKRVIDSLNSQRSSVMKKVLLEILTEKNHYCHIANAVAKSLNRNEELRCLCECRTVMNRQRSITSSASSKSPQTSEKEMRVDSHRDISQTSNESGKSIASQGERDKLENMCAESIVTKL